MSPAGGLPRILCVMGSGETAPTMTSVHSDLLTRMGPPPVPAVLLDTPFGFQENAPDICAKTMQYFRENVGHPIDVASFRDARVATPVERETMLSRLRAARYVFAGPGSPSYALRQWHEVPLVEVLTEKLSQGGCVVFSSAAACTLGRVALPVYEVYKVGEDPRWLDGLDLLSAIGLDVALVPHYNNAEGGTHDTRYCYMGERRLRMLEAELPQGCGILGVDEHTALVVDVEAGTASVRGNGVVTVRRGGGESHIAAGETVPIAVLASGRGATATPVATTAAPAADGAPPAGGRAAGAARARNPFMDGVAEHRAAVEGALAAGDADAALAGLLALDDHLWAWSRDTLDSDDMDRARSQWRSLLVRLAEAAHVGLRDPREVASPYVEAVLALRRRARDERRFEDADALRDALTAAGVEIRDAPGATEWSLRSREGSARGA